MRLICTSALCPETCTARLTMSIWSKWYQKWCGLAQIDGIIFPGTPWWSQFVICIHWIVGLANSYRHYWGFRGYLDFFICARSYVSSVISTDTIQYHFNEKDMQVFRISNKYIFWVTRTRTERTKSIDNESNWENTPRIRTERTGFKIV